MSLLKLKISIKVPFYSTEDKTKLELIIQNLLGDLPILNEIKEDNLIYLTSTDVQTKNLRHFYDYIREHEILDTVRKLAIINPIEKVVSFNLHKQALTIGKIAVISEDTSSPLGNLELIIEPEDIEIFLDWFIPKTFEGKIQNPRKFGDIFNL